MISIRFIGNEKYIEKEPKHLKTTCNNCHLHLQVNKVRLIHCLGLSQQGVWASFVLDKPQKIKPKDTNLVMMCLTDLLRNFKKCPFLASN